MSNASVHTMLDEMERFPEQLAHLIERLDDVRVAHRPSTEEWAPVEVVAHLLDTDRVYAERIARMLGEENPVFVDFDQEAAVEARRGQTVALADTLASFARERAELIGRLRGIEAQQWARTGRHPVRGVGTVEEYVGILYRHDQAHAEQIREAGGLAL